MSYQSPIKPAENGTPCPACGTISNDDASCFTCAATDARALDTMPTAPRNDDAVIDAMAGYVQCDECIGAGKPSNVRTWDRVRGQMHNGWCVRCNGHQRVHIGTRAALISISA